MNYKNILLILILCFIKCHGASKANAAKKVFAGAVAAAAGAGAGAQNIADVKSKEEHNVIQKSLNQQNNALAEALYGQGYRLPLTVLHDNIRSYLIKRNQPILVTIGRAIDQLDNGDLDVYVGDCGHYITFTKIKGDGNCCGFSNNSKHNKGEYLPILNQLRGYKNSDSIFKIKIQKSDILLNLIAKKNINEHIQETENYIIYNVNEMIELPGGLFVVRGYPQIKYMSNVVRYCPQYVSDEEKKRIYDIYEEIFFTILILTKDNLGNYKLFDAIPYDQKNDVVYYSSYYGDCELIFTKHGSPRRFEHQLISLKGESFAILNQKKHTLKIYAKNQNGKYVLVNAFEKVNKILKLRDGSLAIFQYPNTLSIWAKDQSGNYKNVQNIPGIFIHSLIQLEDDSLAFVNWNKGINICEKDQAGQYKLITIIPGDYSNVPIIILNDGSFAAVDSHNTIKIWAKDQNSKYNIIYTIANDSEIASIKQLNNGDLAVVYKNDTVKIWDLHLDFDSENE